MELKMHNGQLKCALFRITSERVRYLELNHVETLRSGCLLVEWILRRQKSNLTY